MKARKGGLGKGLSALIPPAQEEPPAVPERPVDVFFPSGSKPSVRGGSAADLLAPRKRDGKKHTANTKLKASSKKTEGNVSRETSGLVTVPGATFGNIALSDIIPNPDQPRKNFDEDDLRELSESIVEVGLLQPIVIRPLKKVDISGAHYEIVMGERRWQASKLAKLKRIPAIIRRTDDGDMLRDALLENLHRADLNPLEEASAYQQLLEDFNCTQAELADRIKRSRPQIANTIRLLKLPPAVQKRVAAGVISAGHARALLGLENTEDMDKFAERIVAEGWSVRSTEEQIQVYLTGGKKLTEKKKLREARPLSELATNMLNSLESKLDTRVTITEGKKKGKIVIEFAGAEDLARIQDLLK
ncbi:MAG: ParB/RepB/Spo0J family partition protein [Actinomycetaceae bacterium]|nr:ParB/RepB/Spo0J family partition protein [Actinomycetaceae bacterium]